LNAAQSSNTNAFLDLAVADGILAQGLVDGVAIHAYPAKGTNAGTAAVSILTGARNRVSSSIPDLPDRDRVGDERLPRIRTTI
jgi:hypothetical protein